MDNSISNYEKALNLQIQGVVAQLNEHINGIEHQELRRHLQDSAEFRAKQEVNTERISNLSNETLRLQTAVSRIYDKIDILNKDMGREIAGSTFKVGILNVGAIATTLVASYLINPHH